MYDSTERINKIYKVTSEYGNNTNEEDNYWQNCGKKGSKFHQARCNTVPKMTQLVLAKKLTIALGSGIYTILWINFKLTIINMLNNKFWHSFIVMVMVMYLYRRKALNCQVAYFNFLVAYLKT